jgi:hypothetical protein
LLIAAKDCLQKKKIIDLFYTKKTPTANNVKTLVHIATKKIQKIPKLQTSTSELRYKNLKMQRPGKNKCICKNMV